MARRNYARLVTPRAQENSGPNKWFMLRCCLAASMCLILLGIGSGALSETITTIKKEQKTAEEEVQLMALILYVVGLFGSLIMGVISDRFGRRTAILSVSLLFFAAPLLMGITNNFFVALGRMVAHTGVGSTLSIVPIYVAELSPAFRRGVFSCLPEVLVNLGNIAGFGINFFISKLKYNGWRVMICQGIISLFLMTWAVLTLPESPRWLVMRGRLDDAMRIVLRTYRSRREADLQLADIKESVGIPRDCNDAVVVVRSPETSVWEDLLGNPSKPVRHMVVLACVIQILRQACGIEIILLRMPDILDEAGITSSTEKLWWTIGVELVKTVCTIIATFLIDRHQVGRTRLLHFSIAGTALALVPLGASLQILKQIAEKDSWSYVCIASLYVSVALYSLGMGPVTSIYIAELFPLRVRGQACALAFAVNQWAGILISLACLIPSNPIPLSGLVFFFAAVSFVGWALFNKIVTMPETRGVRLEDMENIFGQILQRRSTATRELEMPGQRRREETPRRHSFAARQDRPRRARRTNSM